MRQSPITSRSTLSSLSPSLHSLSNLISRSSRGASMAEKKTINICLIGQKFMGRTHSNAFLKVGKFFDVPLLPVMHTICGRNEAELNEFKETWGWQNAS